MHEPDEPRERNARPETPATPTLRSSLGSALRTIAEVIVPPTCLGCQRRLVDPDTLCGACWQQIRFIRHPVCDRLGLPLPFGIANGPMISAAAAAHPPVWRKARAAAVYDRQGLVARLVHALKYNDRHDARGLFASWLAVAGHELLAEADLIVPVPLTRRRLVARQFNQSALVARALSANTGVAWSPAALTKVRETTPQVELSGVARRDNLRGAFAVSDRQRGAIVDRRVLLLDDVITTGATAEACARALLSAGAAQVDVLAIARVVEPGQVAP